MRQALNYAVDRDGTCKGLLNGLCIPAGQYAPPGNPWLYETFAGYTYDVAKAKSLLAEAGYKDGFKMTIAYPPGGSGNMWPVPMNEKLQQDRPAIGVKVELVPIEWNNIITGYRAGFTNPDWSKYDAIHISLGLTTPTTFGLQYYTSTAIPPAGCCNASGWTNAEYDRLFAEARVTFDAEAQNALLTKAQAILSAEAPNHHDRPRPELPRALVQGARVRHGPVVDAKPDRSLDKEVTHGNGDCETPWPGHSYPLWSLDHHLPPAQRAARRPTRGPPGPQRNGGRSRSPR